MKRGTRVRMSEGLKRAFRGKCGQAGRHLGPFSGDGHPNEPRGDCWGCSTQHVEEFGGCVGIVGGPYFTKVANAKEVEVRWQPSGLRYGYDPAGLVEV